MRFEVRRGTAVLLQGANPHAFPDRETRRSMVGAGLKIYADGRVWREGRDLPGVQGADSAREFDGRQQRLC